MGHQKNVKLIRGQIRQAVKEILPEVLTAELVNNLGTGLSVAVNKRLDEVTNHVKSVLDTVDERSKEVQNYIIRQTAASTPLPTPTENAPEEINKT